MLRITAYADRLLDDLDALDWTDSIKLMQRNWIGRSTGASVRVPGREPRGRRASRCSRPGPTRCSAPRTWCWRPSTRSSTSSPRTSGPTTTSGTTSRATSSTRGRACSARPIRRPTAVNRYRDFAAAKTDLERQSEGKEKTGVFIGAFAINPTNNARIPIFIADYVLMGYGTGAIMAVPAHDERDFEFAREFELPIVPVIRPDDEWLAERDVGPDRRVELARVVRRRRRRAELGERRGLARRSARRRRQARHHRVVGAIRSRSADDHVQVARLALQPAALLGRAVPDRLRRRGSDRAARRRCCRSCCPRSPTSSPSRPTIPTRCPEPPLARAADWVEVELDLAGPEWAGYGDGPRTYVRETNTMPQWAGSCWYYLRYLDPTNEDAMVDPEVEQSWADGHAHRRFTEDRSRRPLRRRRRARGVAPLVRALLAQGVVRPRSRVDDRAVPTAGEPGLHPRRRVRRRAGRVRRGRTRSRSATGSTSSRARRSRASSARWARACATRSRPTTSTATTAPTRCGSTRCSWVRSTRSDRGAPPTSSACTASCSDCGATSSTRRPARRASPTRPPTRRRAGCCTARSTRSAPTWAR